MKFNFLSRIKGSNYKHLFDLDSFPHTPFKGMYIVYKDIEYIIDYIEYDISKLNTDIFCTEYKSEISSAEFMSDF